MKKYYSFQQMIQTSPRYLLDYHGWIFSSNICYQFSFF